MKKLQLVSAAVAGALLLGACGGGSGDASGEAAGGEGGASTSTITLTDNAFSPGDPTVAAGDVALVNEGEAPHTFTVEGEDVDVEVAPGETVTASVDLPAGSYVVFCEFHRTQGMEGTLTVT